MAATMRRSGAAALLSLGALLATVPTVLAQGFVRAPYTAPFAGGSPPTLVNPNPLVGPGVTLQQYAYNVATLGKAYSAVPPYALGYNPYPSPVITTSPYSGVPYTPYYGGSTLVASPYGTASPYTSTLGTSPYADPYTSTLATTGYGGYGSNPYLPYYDPYGGGLQGLADLTVAQGQFQILLQQARITNEKATQARVDTYRRIFDEIRYERMNTPTLEELRLKDIETALSRARHDPPLTEISSGRSLNDLLNHLEAEQGKGLRGPSIPLDEDLLKHINLTSGTGGSVGLLRDKGKLTWPLPLLAPEFTEPREIVEKRVAAAVEAATYGNPIDRAVLTDLQQALRELHKRLDNSITHLSPTEYLEANRYLNQLDDAYKALQDPAVGNYFNQKWVAKGRTVAELVDNLRGQGLTFGPAAPGDEPYYRALHRAMTAYDAGMLQVSKQP